jgi:hypothetical protein
MNTHDLNASANQLEEKNRQAILKVIDLKVEDDMEKVLMKIQSEFGSIRAELANMDSKFEHIDGKFKHMEDKISTVYWAVGLSSAFLAVLIALISILKK